MSTDDNNTKSIQEDYKEKNTKKLIIREVIIGVICIITIVACVLIYNFLLKDKDSATVGQVEDEEELISKIGDTYEGLNYKENETDILKIGFFYDNSRNIEGSKIEVKCKEVSGLRNKSLESKINKTLEDKVKELYDATSVQDANILYEHIYNYTDVYIFNNVLSTLYVKEVCDINGNIEYTYKGVNINLDNFSEIKFEDIFVAGTDINTVTNGKDTTIFSISPKYIYIPEDNGIVSMLSLYDNIDKVAIYNRYKTDEKMFEGTYSAMPYVFTEKHFFDTDLYGKVEDSIFIDTENNITAMNLPDNVLEVEHKLYKEATSKVLNTSYSNPSKRYLAQIVINAVENENGYDINVSYKIYEVNKEFYHSKIIDYVVKAENSFDNEQIDYKSDKLSQYSSNLTLVKTDTLSQTVSNVVGGQS